MQGRQMTFKPSWSVQANFARIEELGLADDYDWEGSPGYSTLVKVFLEEPDARALYKLLKDNNLVAYKNWVDD